MEFISYSFMQRTFKNCTLIFFFSLLFSSAFAQHRGTGPYTAAIGLRGGFLYGISYKQFLNARGAIEAILGTRWQGYSLTGLFEYQKETKFSEDLDWYVGFGAHAGTYEERYFLTNVAKKNSSKSVVAIGVDAVVGAEYKVVKVPVTFGLDFKPFMDLVNGNQNYLDAALTIRYTFN